MTDDDIRNELASTLTHVAEAWRSADARSQLETTLRAHSNRLASARLAHDEPAPLQRFAGMIAVEADALADSARSMREGDAQDAADCLAVAAWWQARARAFLESATA